MKLTINTANEIRSLYAAGGISQALISKLYGTCQMTISKVIRGVVYTKQRPSEYERFFSKINVYPGQGPNGDCHEWTEACCWSGYGQFKRTRSSKMVNASRMAWELTHGDIPEGMEICHHCDNRKCCRDEHLFLGTHAENMADMSRKDRGRKAA